MWFVLIGEIAVLLKVFEIAPVSEWNWFLVLAPFAVAAVWWAWVDATGMTQRKVMRQMDAKKAARRDKQMEALGQGDPTKRKRR